ncbi:MAG: DUF6064 family protein [Ruminococcus sp.]
MDANAFWNVIGEYNQQTIIIQLILLAFIAVAVILSYFNRIKYSAKLILGIANLFIAVVFFGYYGTEPIQKFFALPLYLICGFLFIYESIHNKNDAPEKPNPFQITLIALYCLYPLISLILGNTFPEMVTHVMPCPVVSLSIAVYSCYKRKNKVLLALLTIWGLTGIKSVIFNVYEDTILLICGIYGLYILAKEIRSSKSIK